MFLKQDILPERQDRVVQVTLLGREGDGDCPRLPDREPADVSPARAVHHVRQRVQFLKIADAPDPAFMVKRTGAEAPHYLDVLRISPKNRAAPVRLAGLTERVQRCGGPAVLRS